MMIIIMCMHIISVNHLEEVGTAEELRFQGIKLPKVSLNNYRHGNYFQIIFQVMVV